MPIRFRCQSCGQRYKVKDDLAGKKVRCKKCRNSIVVPSSDAHALDPEQVAPPSLVATETKLSPVIAAADDTSGSITERYGAWKKRHPVWNLVTVALATIILVGAAIPMSAISWKLFEEPKLDKQHAEERARRAGGGKHKEV